MNNAIVRHKKFTCPPNYIKQELPTGLCAEDLESDDIELWFIQSPSEVNLSKVDDQDLQLEGRTSFLCEDGELLKSSAVKYKTDASANQIHCVVPSKNKTLVSVKKKFTGHILFTKSLCIPPFGQGQQPMIKIKEECVPCGSQLQPLGGLTSGQKNMSFGNVIVQTIKKEPASDNESEQTAAMLRKKQKREYLMGRGIFPSMEIKETVSTFSSNCSASENSDQTIPNSPIRKKIKKERISPEIQTVAMSENILGCTSEMKLFAEDQNSNNQSKVPSPKKARRQSIVTSNKAMAVEHNQPHMSEVLLNFPVKIKKEPIFPEDKSSALEH